MLRYSDMKPYPKEAWKEGYTPKSWSEHQSFKFWGRIILHIVLLIFVISPPHLLLMQIPDIISVKFI